MDWSEYVRIKFSDIPQEFIEEYYLSKAAQNGWIYFEILRGCYGQPQSGRLANDLLRTRIKKSVYYEAATTPGLWCHKWRPIQFVLIVDDFGIGVRIKFSDIPQEFIEEYDLREAAQNGWIYFEILRGCYGLPQSGQLANDVLCTRLEKAGYYEAATTPGLWSHKWRPVQFILLVDNFGIEYVGKKHALHLLKTLEQNYEITTDCEGTKFAAIELTWNYNVRHANRTCRIPMDG